MGIREQHGGAEFEITPGGPPAKQSHVRPSSGGQGGVGLYLCLMTMQTAGVAILLYNWIPLYRMMAIDFANYRPDLAPWWAVAGTLLIQVAYWPQLRLEPPLARRGGVVLGHIILFVARVCFVSVTAGFTVLFYNRIEQLRDMGYSPVRALVVLLMGFSVFCWTFELERLAAAFRKGRA